VSKKNKKKNNPFTFDFFGPEPVANKEGDLRFNQKNTVVRHKKWWGYDEELREGKKMLQRFDGKEWQDIPMEYEYTYVD